MSTVGEFETLMLLAILRLEDGAYGVALQQEIHERTGRRLTRGAIYTTLRRLESKGLIQGDLGDATPVRGGRAKKFFRLTPVGRHAVSVAVTDLDRMRDGLRILPGKPA